MDALLCAVESFAAAVNAADPGPDASPEEGWKAIQETGLVYPQEHPFEALTRTEAPPPAAAILYGLDAVTGAEHDCAVVNDQTAEAFEPAPFSRLPASNKSTPD